MFNVSNILKGCYLAASCHLKVQHDHITDRNIDGHCMIMELRILMPTSNALCIVSIEVCNSMSQQVGLSSQASQKPRV